MAKSLLEAYDIPVVVIDGVTIGQRPSYASIFGGIKLQVPESRIEEAQRIFLESAPQKKTQSQPMMPNPYSKLVWTKPLLAALFALFVYWFFSR